MDTALVQALLPVQAATPIPQTPSFILGLVHHGERALVLLDLGAFLGLPPPSGPDVDLALRRVVVVATRGMEVGLVCDRATGIVSPPRASWRDRSLLQGDRLTAHVAAEIDAPQGVIGILDLPGLLDAARIRQ